MMECKVPKYGVRAAAERIGVSPATLRAWEKRYGVPTPARTASSYRLYSERDVALARWMRARMAEGVPAHRAAELALSADEREIERAAGTGVAGPDALSDAEETGKAVSVRFHRSFVERIIPAALAFDERRIREVIREASAVLSATDVMREVLLPAIARIGSGWESGRITIAQEHFASQLARSYASHLLDAYEEHGDVPPLVCACAPGETHELGLLTVAVELRHRGVPVVYLGPDVPVEDVLDTAVATAAAGIVITLTVEGGLEAWSRHRELLRRAIIASGLRVLWAGPAAEEAASLDLPGARAATIDDAIAAAVSMAGEAPRRAAN